MKNILRLAPALLLLPVFGCASTGLVNSGLERSRTADGSPEGWKFSNSEEGGYRASVDREESFAGGASVLIESVNAPADPFGNLMQSVDAAPYRGKRVRYRAAVRAIVDGVGAAQLWLRVDREQGRHGFFDNMAARPITAPRWAHYEIVADVAEDATKINVGVFLRGKGRIWFDKASLEVLGPAREGLVSPRPLSKSGSENLIAFARLLGYVRYFCPSDESAAADWESVAIEGVEAVETARGPLDLADRLRGIFAPLAPRLRILPTLDESEHAEVLAESDNTRVMCWYHMGVGLQESSIYSSRRIRVRLDDERLGADLPHPDKPFRAYLGAGVSCVLPMVLPVGDPGTGSKTAPLLHRVAGKPKAFIPTGNDRSTRLAATILAWNILQHFYPYFDVVGGDWGRSLRIALGAAAIDKDEVSFLTTLRRLVADLRDGHGSVSHSSDRRQFRVPVRWAWIESRLVITQTAPDAAGLEPGDVVLSIGGSAVGAALEAERADISGATRQWIAYRAIEALGTGSHGDSLELVVQGRKGETRSVSLMFGRPRFGDSELLEHRPPAIAEIRPGIHYVDLDRITDDDFAEALPDLGRAHGLIFDLRGYPSVSTNVLAHLIDESVSSAQWQVPIVTRPNRVGMRFRESSWKIEPKTPRLPAPAVFLTDGRAISYAETYLAIVEHYRLAEIVGGPTAGTNGNVNTFRLPGGYVVNWTGMKVLKHDGSQHHGVGVQPSFPASRTIAGVREGRDEVLETAVQLLVKTMTSPVAGAEGH